MTRQWWAAQAPVDVTVACGPNRHRLRWDRAVLVALDHEDAGGEAVRTALGGRPPACVDLVAQWAAHAGDAAVLVAAPRHPGDAATPRPPALEGAARAVEQIRRQGTNRPPAAGRPAPDGATSAERQLELLRLLALPAPLVRRLQQEVAADLAAATERGDPSAAAALEAAALGRARPALRRWQPDRRWDVVLGPPGIRTGPVATLSVGPWWLAEVWGSYLTVVDGWLVLDVREAGDGRAEVTAVRSPGATPRHLRLTGPAPWRVA